MGISILNVRTAFGSGPLAVVSWNNDVLSYAYNARHLAELGRGSPGWIAGFDVGAAAKWDVIGAFGLLVPFGYVAGDSLRATLPVMAALTIAVAMAGFLIIRVYFKGPDAVAAIGSLVFAVGFPMSYNAYQYFLAERLAIVVILAALVLCAAPRSTYAIGGVAALATAALILAYPHVTPIGIAVLAICVLVGAQRVKARSLRGSLYVLFAVGFGSLLGSALLGQALVERIDRARGLLSVVAGWPMPTFSLAEMVGLREPLARTSRAEAAAVEIAALVLVLLVVVIMSRWRYRSMAVVCFAFLVPSLLYLRFAFAEPDSYRQWKAMAFAVPFAILALIGLVLIIAGVVGVDRLRFAHTQVVVALLVLGFLISASAQRYDASSDLNACLSTDCPISEDFRNDMAEVADVVGDDSVAIQRGAYWPSMAAAYLLWGRPIVMREPNYWGLSDAPATYTLYSGELVGPTPN
jgi:hypothetical protein